MKKHFSVLTLFFCLLFYSIAYSQWSAGISVNLRKEQPKWGLGFLISRNLPFQFPTIGLKVRLEADLFNREINRIELSEKSFFLSLVSTYFLRHVEPYLSLAPGYAFISTGDRNSNAFIIEGTAGIQLAITEPVYPFLEFKGRQYFVTTGARRFDLLGTLGVRFEF